MKKLKEHFYSLSINHKLLISFIIPMCIMLALSLILTEIALHLYDNKIYSLEAEKLDSIIETVDEKIKEIDSISYSAAMDSATQSKLNTIVSSKDAAYLYGLGDIFSSFAVAFSSNKLTDDYIFINKITDFRSGDRASRMGIEEVRRLEEKAASKYGALYIDYDSSNSPYLVTAREIRHFLNADLKGLGTLIFITDINDIVGQHNNEIYLYNNDGELMYGDESKSNKIAAYINMPGYTIEKIDGERLFISVAKGDDITSISIFPYSKLFSLTRLTRTMLIVSFILLYFLVFISIKKLTESLTRPIKALSSSMVLASEGELEKAADILDNYHFMDDEIGRLANEYKAMIIKLNKLIIERYEEELLLKDTRYKMLKAQINPHFLYNTLNSIGWAIKLKKASEAGKMLQALGNLLHKAFDLSTVTTLGEEKALFEDYAYIQKIRYGERFIYSLDIPADLDEVKIPPLTLQPLVENAIKYGTDTTGDATVVALCAAEEDKAVILKVEDNGPGFSKERLQEVKSLDYKGRGSGIGIKNIAMRLNLIYGTDGQLEIESEKGHTVITIKLPKEVKDVQGNSN